MNAIIIKDGKPSTRVWREDLTGSRYGRLVVVKFDGNRGRRRYWECLCDCGKISYCEGGNLKAGQIGSCGCLERELTSARKKSHGESYSRGRSKEYRTWNDIKTRCYNPKSKSYSYYGAKGITVCDRWLNSYDDFLSDMGRAPSPNHSIERNDFEKNYEPQNCRWATRLEQMNNTSRTIRIKFNGQIKSLSVWCRELNISRKLVYQRIHVLKWSAQDALTKPCSFQ
jgi:hypothetical protein